MSTVSLAEGIARGTVEINFQDFHGMVGCIENFQDVTRVIHDVTLLDTENRKRHRQGNLHRFTCQVIRRIIPIFEQNSVIFPEKPLIWLTDAKDQEILTEDVVNIPKTSN